MGLSNPSFSKKFFFNKWLPYILINMVFMHSCDENILFHDRVTADYRFYSPQALRLKIFKRLLVTIISFITT